MTLISTSTLPHRAHRWLTRTQPEVLNPGSAPGVPDDLFNRLKTTQSAIARQAFDADSGHVNYAQLADDPHYAAYRALTPALATVDLATLQRREDKLAFWINLYNLLAVDIVLHYQITTSVNDVPTVFYRAGYNVGGAFYSLHDIEQGILRANVGHPGIPGPQFGAADPRRAHALAQVDPRTHFALVCAAESCPPIRLYDADQIDAQLDLATTNFINSSAVTIDVAERRALLSKIFQWYAPDFGASFMVTLGLGAATPILRWLAPYLTDTVRRDALTRDSSAFTVRFAKYDWRLNAL